MSQDQKIKDLLEGYAYARDNGHLDYVNKAKKCEAFFYGDQWDEVVASRLARQGRPAMTLNKILPAMAAVMGEQLNNKADVSFRPSASGRPETAAALDKLYLHIANDNDLDWIESAVFDDGIITSRGFMDIRMNFDEHIRGEVKISVENNQNVVIDPDAEEYDPDFWKEVYVTRWVSLNDIRRMYGEEYYKELKDRNRAQSALGYDAIDRRTSSFANSDLRESYEQQDSPHRRRLRTIERQYKEYAMKQHFIDKVTGQTSPIPSDWDYNKISYVLQATGLGTIKRPTECIHWVTGCDDVLLHDKVSPYKYFTIVPFFPFFRRGKTIGLVEGQIDPQQMYNKNMSQMFHIVNTTANSGWKVKTGALQNMTVEDLEERGAETGLVIEATDVNDVEKIQPNHTPTGLDRLAYLLSEDQKDISMVSDSARGFDRADVAAKAIMAKKASGSQSFAKPLDNLAKTRKLVASRILSLVQTFYTEERTYRITGGGLQPKNEEVVINQMTPEGEIINDITVGEYSVTINTVPARNDYEDSQFEESMRLREVGVQIPDHVLIEHSHLNRKMELAEEIKQRTGWGEQTELEKQAQIIEQQLQQLEVEKSVAERAKIESETTLNLVRAQQAAEEENQDGQGDIELERIGIERERMLREAELREYEIKEKIRLEEEKLDLKRQEIIQNAVLKRAEAAQKLADSKRKEAEAKQKQAEKPAKTES